MPTLWQRSLALLRAPGNEVGFALRRRVRWSRGPAALPHEAKPGWLLHLPAAAREAAGRRAAALARDFELAALAARSTRLVYAENVALLDRLEALRGDLALPDGAGALRALDVGCGAFAYATALQRWLRHAGGPAPRAVTLRGIELDGYGVYRDGHSRADHAAAHAALAGPGVSFEVGDFTRLPVPPQDVVTLLYPFLSAYPLLRWGLPLRHLRPRRLLARAVAALRPGGVLVVANQTAAEFDRLAAWLGELPVALVARAPFATDLLPYAARTAGRIGSLWRRQNALPDARPNG